MTDRARASRVDAADLAALIERAGAAVALAEEPSNFSAALETGADPESGPRE
jgi:hypothetical protein